MIELVVGRSDRATGAVRSNRSCYRLAGHRVSLTSALPEIEAFRDASPDAADPLPSAWNGCAGGGTLVYRGPAWIGQRERTVECRRTEDGLRVAIDGIGRVEVAADGRHAGLFDPRPSLQSKAGPALLAEALLGPALILALAARGTLCVHASALALAPPRGESGEPSEAGVIAFLGPSGAGKSTLARLLDGVRPGWRRAADDVLPLGWDAATGSVATAYPRFPQLKLDAAAQPGASLPEALPVAALFVLAPREHGVPERPATRLLTRAEAALALVRHTASARLFDRPLLAWHLELCSALAERLRVAELAYPWRGHLVPGLVEAVAAGPEVA